MPSLSPDRSLQGIISRIRLWVNFGQTISLNPRTYGVSEEYVKSILTTDYGPWFRNVNEIPDRLILSVVGAEDIGDEESDSHSDTFVDYCLREYACYLYLIGRGFTYHPDFVERDEKSHFRIGRHGEFYIRKERQANHK